MIHSVCKFRFVCVTALAASFVFLSAPSAQAQITVVPPGSTVAGQTLGQWSASWWQWAFSLPIDHHPLYDTADADTGQSGNVFFLGSTFVASTGSNGQTVAIADRSISVSGKQYLFFPITNSEASTLEGNGTTDAELRAAAQGFQDSAQNNSAELDGVSVSNIDSYRVASPLSQYGPLPDNNIIESFGIPNTVGATSDFVSDGVYLMLNPLVSGQHTIHFHGEIPAFNFLLDTTYHITVVPEPGGIALLMGVAVPGALLMWRRRRLRQ